MALILRGNGTVEGMTSAPDLALEDNSISASKLTSDVTSSTSFRTYRTSTQTVTAGNAITWDGVNHDTASALNTSTGGYTIPKTGYWFFHLIITSAGGQGTPYFYLAVNGSRVRDLIETLSWTTNTERHASSLLYCTQGEIITTVVNGANFDVQGGSTAFHSNWQGFYLGA